MGEVSQPTNSSPVIIFDCLRPSRERNDSNLLSWTLLNMPWVSDSGGQCGRELVLGACCLISNVVLSSMCHWVPLSFTTEKEDLRRYAPANKGCKKIEQKKSYFKEAMTTSGIWCVMDGKSRLFKVLKIYFETVSVHLNHFFSKCHIWLNCKILE